MYIFIDIHTWFQGKTTMYGRNGKCLEQFYSVLPGGSSLTAHKGYSMFDCVVCYDDNTFYILDMVAWTNQSVMQCEVGVSLGVLGLVA